MNRDFEFQIGQFSSSDILSLMNEEANRAIDSLSGSNSHDFGSLFIEATDARFPIEDQVLHADSDSKLSHSDSSSHGSVETKRLISRLQGLDAVIAPLNQISIDQVNDYNRFPARALETSDEMLKKEKSRELMNRNGFEKKVRGKPSGWKPMPRALRVYRKCQACEGSNHVRRRMCSYCHSQMGPAKRKKRGKIADSTTMNATSCSNDEIRIAPAPVKHGSQLLPKEKPRMKSMHHVTIPLAASFSSDQNRAVELEK